VLAADLGRTLLAGCELPATLKLELPGVVSPRLLLLLHPDVTLHPISWRSSLTKLSGERGAPHAEVAPGIVFHHTPEGEVTAIDIDSEASKLVDLSRLEVEGLPTITVEGRRERSEVG
jgi:hypothetical protein